MNRKQIIDKHLKDLLSRRDKILTTINDELPLLANEGASIEDIELTNSDVTSSLVDSYSHELKAINQAIRNIEDNNYGICCDCEKNIPVARLEALPFALRCIPCQEKYELNREFERIKEEIS